MSANNNNNNNKVKKKTIGVDTLLTRHGKTLAAGQGLSIRLIKGPAPQENPDPVDSKAPKETFPILAKFPVSVVRPDFTAKPYRLYQQDVPKAVEDSDEEAMGEEPKKRWKSRKKEVPQRQWILQQEVEFFETMLAKREQSSEGNGADEAGAAASTSSSKNKKLSARYEGTPEQNTSQYIVLRLPPPDAVAVNPEALADGRCLQVCQVPANAMVAFAQPDARKTFSLTQAERVIEDQRNSVQTLHHLHDSKAAAEPTTIQEMLGRKRGATADKKPKDSKSRLLNKFSKMEAAKNPNAEVDDGDDVMADVAYRNRKGAGSARKELLESVGDGLKVSDEGVLGGANDEIFGGRQRFGQFKADQNKEDNKNAPRGESQATQERGADGAAMEEDFYQRDVQAEYEEMDFDANELFDDDDVDVGEKEVEGEHAGFGGPDDEDDDEDESDSEGDEEEVSGAAGLASSAGFRELLKKARGEGPPPGSQDAPEANGGAADGKADAQGKDNKKRKRKAENDHVSKFLAATGKGRPIHKQTDSRKRVKTNDAEETQPMETEAPAAAPAPSAPPPIDPSQDGFQLGPDGLRVLTLAAVRCELWLNGSSMPTKRLMKVFDIKKKSPPERKRKFMEIVNELCTDQMDPVHGKMKVLKQHWSHMG